jgi:hypothetical protein
VSDKKIQGGYYIKAKRITESEINRAAPVVRELWDLLLRTVNFASRDRLHIGQRFVTIKGLMEELHWRVGFRKETYSSDQCEYGMKWLMNRDMITVTKAVNGSIVTVCNYEFYQNQSNYESAMSPLRVRHESGMNGGNKTEEGKNKEESILSGEREKKRKRMEESIAFYEVEVSMNLKAEFIKQYTGMVNRLLGRDDTGKVYENILGLKRQVRYKDYVTIRHKAESLDVPLPDILDQMENYALLTTKNIDASLTIQNWMRKEHKRQEENVQRTR